MAPVAPHLGGEGEEAARKRRSPGAWCVPSRGERGSGGGGGGSALWGPAACEGRSQGVVHEDREAAAVRGVGGDHVEAAARVGAGRVGRVVRVVANETLIANCGARLAEDPASDALEGGAALLGRPGWVQFAARSPGLSSLLRQVAAGLGRAAHRSGRRSRRRRAVRGCPSLKVRRESSEVRRSPR